LQDPAFSRAVTAAKSPNNNALTLYVWSGRALQEVLVEMSACGLASMYPASDWSSSCSRP
jgi:hypothetical protein